MNHLFFRIVNASYKKREYVYLKLLESHREGGKIKHRQLVNLSESVQLQSDSVKPLFEELNQTLVLLKTFNELAPPSYRYLKASYVMAMENAFKIEQRCREQDLREIMIRDWKRKHTKDYDEIIFNDTIQKESISRGESQGIICWLENLNLYVLDGKGFPLRLIHRHVTEGEDIAEYLLKLKISEKKPDFFLGRACELLYNTFRHMTSRKKSNGYTMKEIFVYRQLMDWSGKASFNFDKILILGADSCLNDERVSVGLMALNSLKDQIDYVNGRINSITGGISVPEKDLNCTYFMSYLFKKIFDDIRMTHNI